MIIKLINEMINIHRTRRRYFSTLLIHIPRTLFHRFVLKKKALSSQVTFKIKELDFMDPQKKKYLTIVTFDVHQSTAIKLLVRLLFNYPLN